MIKKPILEGVLLGGLAAGLLAAACIVPYRFPPRDFVVGASYEVGFNNTVSYFLYLLFVPFLVLVAARMLPLQGKKRAASLSRRSSRVARLVAAMVILAHVVLFTGLYAYKGRLVFAEGLYFQSLLYRMTQGDIPYIDFGFYYGPLMLYPAYWLTKALGLYAGYAVWFVTTYLIGLLFLYVLLSFCLTSARSVTAWFVFLALGLFNPLTGLNVTFTRYLFPSIVFLGVASFLRKGGWIRGLAAGASLGAAVTYTFEVAALSVGVTILLCLVYAVDRETWARLIAWLRPIISCRQSSGGADESPAPAAALVVQRTTLLLMMAAVVCVAAFLLIDPSGRALREYPGIAQSYSGGAHNVPIYPHLPFLALSTITVAALAALLRLTVEGDAVLTASALAYAAVALVTQRAAFGAAEPSHFAYFGLPVFMVGIFAAGRLERHRTMAQAALAAVLLVGIMLPMQYYHFTEFLPFVAQRIHFSPSVAAAPAEAPQAGATLEQNLRAVVRAVGADHPYVMYEMEYSSLPVYRDFGLRYAIYSTMLITARDGAGIRRAIEEVRARRAVVVVRRQDLSGLERPRSSTGVWRALDLLSGAHTGGSELNALLLKSKTRLMSPFLEFVQAEYVPRYDRSGLVAFGPR